MLVPGHSILKSQDQGHRAHKGQGHQPKEYQGHVARYSQGHKARHMSMLRGQSDETTHRSVLEVTQVGLKDDMQ